MEKFKVLMKDLDRYGNSRHYWKRLRMLSEVDEWLLQERQEAAALTLQLGFLEETWENIKANKSPSKEHRHAIVQDIRIIEHDRARKIGRIWQVQDKAGMPRLVDGRALGA